MNALQNFLVLFLGQDGKATELTLLQISLRGLVIFFVGLALVRIGDRRSLSEKTAFDAIFIVLVGSMLSRAINGTAPFLATIAAGTALMIIHRACAFGACKLQWFGKLIKGQPVTLVWNGEINWTEMQRSLVSKKTCVWTPRPRTSPPSNWPASNAAATSRLSRKSNSRHWTLGACRAVALRRRVGRWTFPLYVSRQAFHPRPRRSLRQNLGRILPPDDRSSQ